MAHPVTYSNATLLQIVLGYHEKKGSWPTVRHLRKALKVGTNYAAKAIRDAKEHYVAQIELNPYFAALATAYATLSEKYVEATGGSKQAREMRLGDTPEEIRDALDRLNSRYISPRKHNTQLSILQLRMIMAMQDPTLDTSHMTKAKLLDHISDPAVIDFRKRVYKLSQSNGEADENLIRQGIKKLEAVYELSLDHDSQANGVRHAFFEKPEK